LYAWLFMMQKNEVTTREIGVGLNRSERHAARILKSLSEKKVAKIIGKESIHQKGRPRHPFEGIKVTGEPVSVLSRGKFVIRNKQFVGNVGAGRYLRRAKYGVNQQKAEIESVTK
jgi:hypothetical protein